MQSVPVISQKPRFEILDGLRGVAAIIVVAFHIFEIYSPSPELQIINHGYLAVDFFFALSGFVLGYAYDDRWGKSMNIKQFAVRRLIRLQPMVIAGATFGAMLYYFGLAHIDTTTVGTLMLVWLLSCLLLPTNSSLDIRGWGEGYSLDGPQWSLAFEYIANILYALFIRRFPKWLLGMFVACAALLSVDVAFNLDIFGMLAGREAERYTMIGGWSLAPTQLYVGFTRLLYPFFAGLLVYRIGGRLHAGRMSFALCSAMIAGILLMPRVGIGAAEWTNGLYEAFCVLVMFPVILMIGAGTMTQGERTTRLCNWLGRISYPLYITHYPLIYMLFDWRYKNDGLSTDVHIYNGIVVLLLSILVAYSFERLYDIPVRRWLTERFSVKRGLRDVPGPIGRG